MQFLKKLAYLRVLRPITTLLPGSNFFKFKCMSVLTIERANFNKNLNTLNTFFFSLCFKIFYIVQNQTVANENLKVEIGVL